MQPLPKIEFKNLFQCDPTGQKLWQYWLGKETYQKFLPRYDLMGKNGALATSFSALTDQNPPRIHNISPQGERIDRIEYHPAHESLKQLSYGSGILSFKYNPEFLKQHKKNRHLIGFSTAYYFAQTETGLFCPICMTDALGRVLERHNSHPMSQKALAKIVSDDLETLWTGAMFLTEIQGGSDVGANTTRAESRDGKWYLYGDKWFCSNADAEVSLALARMPGAEGAADKGTRGLGLFLVLRNDPPQNHKTWLTHRLKKKLGVQTMASGEITFQGTEAYLIGGAGEGFKIMTEMVNMSRIYNAVSSIAIVRRSVLEAYAFAQQRKAFGHALVELPLWRAGMADLVAEQMLQQFLVFETTHQLDRADTNESDGAHLVRLMTPLAKALSGKLSVFTASEAMELIGGNAYIEEHILPRLLRDAQVLPIWEGTTNIQSLDFLRALQKEGAQPLFARMESSLSKAQCGDVILRALRSRLTLLQELLQGLTSFNPQDAQRSAREVLEKAGRLLSMCLVAEATADSALKELCEATLKRSLLRESSTTALGGSSAKNLADTEDVLLKSIY